MKNNRTTAGKIARFAVIGSLVAAAGVAQAAKIVGPVTTTKMVCIIHPGGHLECTKVK